MKTILPIKPSDMKNIFLLFVLFTGIVNAQITLGTPTTYYSCTGTFDLTSKNAQILASNSASLYSVAYFKTQENATGNTNPITNPTMYVNSGNVLAHVYARVWENAHPNNFATTILTVDSNVPYYSDTYYHSMNIGIRDIPYDGFATFDLSANTAPILSSNPNCVVTYYPSLVDAQNNTNLITTPAAYTNTTNTKQAVGYRITNTISGCYYTGVFNIVTVNEPILNFPDPIFKWRLVNLMGENFAYDINGNNLFSIDTNQDGEIEVSEALAVYQLNVNNIYLSVVIGPHINDMTGIENFSNINTLYCNGNHLTSLDVRALTHLKYFQCEYNQLTSLNVDGLTNLQVLYANVNELASIDLSSLTNLKELALASNNFTTLDISGLTHLNGLILYQNQLSYLDNDALNSLTYLDISSNLFTSINTNALTHLKSLVCDYNQLSVLDLEPVNLTLLKCNNNQLTSLDVSASGDIQILECNNNQLQYLFIKTGTNSFSGLSFSGNPNLGYICTDESKMAIVQANVNLYGYTNCVVNSYCSFVPGGNYNTITGNITFDNNNNGCDASDLHHPNMKITVNDGTNSGSTFSNVAGSYNIYTQAGSFNLTPQIENPTFFEISPPTSTVVFANNQNNISNQSFCVQGHGDHSDIEMVIIPVTTARPGFEAVYELVYKNKGNQVDDIHLNLTYNDALMDYVSSDSPLVLFLPGQLNGMVPNVQPFESGRVKFTLRVNPPTATPPVNNGDILTFNSFVDVTTDENWTDNAFTLDQTVVGSFDPNDIICLEGQTVAPTEIGKYLHYIVNFENTGTAAAENIVIATQIDPAQFDINSIQLINASHDAYTRITGNKVEFVFQNINLAARAIDPPVGGHGSVLYKIRTKAELATNDTVVNAAGIYFDYNFPVITNDAETTFALLNNPIFDKDENITVYPNPTASIININSKFNIRSVELYDVQGRLLETIFQTTSIDISSKANGVYFLKITSDKGSKVEKIVKK